MQLGSRGPCGGHTAVVGLFCRFLPCEFCVAQIHSWQSEKSVVDLNDPDKIKQHLLL